MAVHFPASLTKLNVFQQVPESFESLTNCITLKLDDNQIEKLPDNLGRMTALEELYAAENFLTFLPPIAALLAIVLSGCRRSAAAAAAPPAC